MQSQLAWESSGRLVLAGACIILIGICMANLDRGNGITANSSGGLLSFVNLTNHGQRK